ncbi:protein FAM177A1 isoform X2 [Rhodnius prolixus]|uniref:protein FAM177A1 isoform X2 n=1 Tax=Rhodnius prolixus TaxID=13249 RepID=UPI003D18A8C0
MNEFNKQCIQEIPSSASEMSPSESQTKQTRVPKRILHFSDGTLEEFSSDEDDDIEPSCKKRTASIINAINPATLAWIPWMIYQSSIAGNKALAICDFFGEYLANFFGITTPKYDYEIEYYKRMIEEEKERKKQDLELGDWEPAKPDIIVSEQLKHVERYHTPDGQQWTHYLTNSEQV